MHIYPPSTSNYDYIIWESMSKIVDKLQQYAKDKFKALMSEGHLVTRSALQATLDSTDSAAGVMAAEVILAPELWHTYMTLRDTTQTSKGVYHHLLCNTGCLCAV